MIWQTLNYNSIKPVRLAEVWQSSRTVRILVYASLFSLIVATPTLYLVFNEADVKSRSEIIQNIAFVVQGLFLFVPLVTAIYLHTARKAIFIKRMNKFATTNKPHYSDFTFETRLYSEGILFYDSTQKKAATAEFSGDIGLPFTMGNHRVAHKPFGYIRFKLPRRLPNMVLDANFNNSAFKTTMPSTVRSDQKLSLEGDFDKYYTLYVPKQYETDALYVFTPILWSCWFKPVHATT